ARPLMDDVRAVKWLPLRSAIETLSRPHERVFLSDVGPVALKASASARRAASAEPIAPSEPVAPSERMVPSEPAAELPPEPALVEVETEAPVPATLGGTLATWLRRLTPFAR